MRQSTRLSIFFSVITGLSISAAAYVISLIRGVEVSREIFWIVPVASAIAAACPLAYGLLIRGRLEELKNAFRSIEEDEEYPRLPPREKDLIGGLENAFNRMSEGMERRARSFRESEEMLKNVTASINEYIYSVEVKGSKFLPLLVTERVRDITGYSPLDFLSNHRLWLEIVHPEDRKIVLKDFIKKVLKDEQFTSNYRIIHSSGDIRYIQNSVRTTFDEGGAPMMLNGTVEDISERVSLEQQLQQAQKIKAIGMLAGGIAHDFNNILSSILGYVSMMREKVMSKPEISGELEKPLQVIEGSAEKGAELTRQLLGFAMKGKYVPQVVDLNRIVKETIEMVKRTFSKKISVVGQLAGGLPFVKVDPSQISQVLINLCINSRDAMPEGGELVMETRTNPTIPFELRESLRDMRGDIVMVSVKDTGIGMEEETLSRVFEPFFTTKPTGKGTGLGLSMTYGIIKNHGGDIIIKSKHRKGTEVRIFLPATSETPLKEEAASPVREKALKSSLRVLVVDDEEFVREFLVEALSTLGHLPRKSSSGEEALRLYSEDGRDIDVVILDMLMPGLDGKKTLKCLKKMNPDICVVIASGYLPEEDAEELMEQDVFKLLRKPFKIDDLKKTLEQAAVRLSTKV